MGAGGFAITGVPTRGRALKLACALMVGLVFLHGGVLAAPLHGPLTSGADPELGNDPAANETLLLDSGASDGDNMTLVGESLVRVEVTPPGPETLDLVDFAAIHQSTASIQSFLESSGYFFESVTRFFREMVSTSPPTLDYVGPPSRKAKPPSLVV